MRKSEKSADDLGLEFEAKSLASIMRDLVAMIQSADANSAEPDQEISVAWPSERGTVEARAFPDAYEALRAAQAKLRNIFTQRLAKEKKQKTDDRQARDAERAWAKGFLSRWQSAAAREQEKGIECILSFAARGIKIAGPSFAEQAELAGEMAKSLWAKGVAVDKISAKIPENGESLGLLYFLDAHAPEKLNDLGVAGAVPWRSWERATRESWRPWSAIWAARSGKIGDYVDIWTSFMLDQARENMEKGKPAQEGLREDIYFGRCFNWAAESCESDQAVVISYFQKLADKANDYAQDYELDDAELAALSETLDMCRGALTISQARDELKRGGEYLLQELDVRSKCRQWIAALRGALACDGVEAATMIVHEIKKISSRGLRAYDESGGGLLAIAAEAKAFNCARMLLAEGTPVAMAWEKGRPSMKNSPLLILRSFALGGDEKARRLLGEVACRWRDELGARLDGGNPEAVEIISTHLRAGMPTKPGRLKSKMEAELLSATLLMSEEEGAVAKRTEGKGMGRSKPAMRL